MVFTLALQFRRRSLRSGRCRKNLPLYGPAVNSDQTSNESLTASERFVGWMRFLVFLIGLIVVLSAATQVYERWEPANANPIPYAISSFTHYVWPRLLIGSAIGGVFLAIAMLFRRRPPWIDSN